MNRKIYFITTIMILGIITSPIMFFFERGVYAETETYVLEWKATVNDQVNFEPYDDAGGILDMTEEWQVTAFFEGTATINVVNGERKVSGGVSGHYESIHKRDYKHTLEKIPRWDIRKTTIDITDEGKNNVLDFISAYFEVIPWLYGSVSITLPFRSMKLGYPGVITKQESNYEYYIPDQDKTHSSSSTSDVVNYLGLFIDVPDSIKYNSTSPYHEKLKLGFQSVQAGSQHKLFYADWEVTVHFPGGCKIDSTRSNIPDWNQYNDGTNSWYDDPYDHSIPPRTIAGLGCLLTSFAMALKNAGVDTDPGELNEWMTEHTKIGEKRKTAYVVSEKKNKAGEITRRYSAVNLGYTTRNLTDNALRFNFQIDNKDIRKHGQSTLDTLEKILCEEGYPVIVGVKRVYKNGTKAEGAHHWALVVGKEGDRFRLHDPGKKKYLDEYSKWGYEKGDFYIRGFVVPMNYKSPSSIFSPKLRISRIASSALMAGFTDDSVNEFSDISELSIFIGNEAELLVIAPDGKKTGFDYNEIQDKEEIPQSAYFREGLEELETGNITNEFNSVHVFQPQEGTYQIVLIGQKSDTYNLTIEEFRKDGSYVSPVFISGIVEKDSIISYEVQIEKDTIPNPRATEQFPSWNQILLLLIVLLTVTTIVIALMVYKRIRARIPKKLEKNM